MIKYINTNFSLKPEYIDSKSELVVLNDELPNSTMLLTIVGNDLPNITMDELTKMAGITDSGNLKIEANKILRYIRTYLMDPNDIMFIKIEFLEELKDIKMK